MKTVAIKIYSFDELSEAAQQKAIQHHREYVDTSFIYDDAHNSVKEFHNIFNTKEGTRSWLDVRTDHLDNDICNLYGLRLQKYIWNNFGKSLYKGRYYSLWSKTEKSYIHHKEGYPVLKKRYSKVLFDNCCVLTGVCYDDTLLQPVYEFLEDYRGKSDYYSYMNFEQLMQDCFTRLESDIDSEVEYRTSDEGIIEELQESDTQYREDGSIFYE